jgi:serine O-acetyltransferase
MARDWRAKLEADTGRRTLTSVFVAMVMEPSSAAIVWVRLMLAFQARNTRVSRLFSRLVAGHLARTYGIHMSVLIKEIGSGFQMPHPTGIVIGDGTVIGDNVLILQNVTLGRRAITQAGCPVIKNGVQILAGAVIVGAVTIGENAVVGANAVVLSDVAANATVVGAPARPVRA